MLPNIQNQSMTRIGKTGCI